MSWQRLRKSRWLLIAIAVCAAGGVSVKYLRWYVLPKRFYVVQEGQLYRGGYQTPRVLRHLIDKYGIKTVASLALYPHDDARFIDEQRVVRQTGAGFHVFDLPGDGCGPFDELEAAAAVLADPQQRPVFFHCAAGVHRSNAVLAVWRMKYQGWSLEQALAEAEKYGLSRTRHRRLVDHLRRYYQERIAKSPSHVRTASPGGRSGREARTVLAAGRATSRASVVGSDLAWAVPADALFVYQARPAPGTSGTARPSPLIQGIRLLGVGTVEGQVFLDFLSSVPVVAQFDHAVAVMSLQVKQRQRVGSYKLKYMQAALLVKTGGHNDRLISQVADIVQKYTSRQTADLMERRFGRHTFQVLHDRRLPRWCATQFGPVGELYVVGFGDGAFERICRVVDGLVPGLAANPWYRRAGGQVRAADAVHELFGNTADLKAQLAVVLKGRPEQVAEALGLGDLQRFRWALGFEGSAQRSLAWMGGADGDNLLVLSEPAQFPADQQAVIPQAATGFSITRLDVAWLAKHIARALLVALRPDKAERLRARWAKMQTELSLNFETDLLPHLGPYLIIHNYPLHPGGVPFMVTVLLQHDGSPRVRTCVQRLLSEWQQLLDEEASHHPKRAFNWRLECDPNDGIWFVRAGMLTWHGLAVTDRYIVISWSREAVRENLAFLQVR